MKKSLEEQVIQKFPNRCPYCEQPVSYEHLHLKPGENEVICPSCKKKYIKVVSDDWEQMESGKDVRAPKIRNSNI